jgi:hypothetical protein
MGQPGDAAQPQELDPELAVETEPELVLEPELELEPVRELVLDPDRELVLVVVPEPLLVPVPVHPQPKQSALSGVPGGPSTPQWSCMRAALPSARMLAELPAQVPLLQKTSTAGAMHPVH